MRSALASCDTENPGQRIGQLSPPRIALSTASRIEQRYVLRQKRDRISGPRSGRERKRGSIVGEQPRSRQSTQTLGTDPGGSRQATIGRLRRTRLRPQAALWSNPHPLLLRRPSSDEIGAAASVGRRPGAEARAPAGPANDVPLVREMGKYRDGRRGRPAWAAHERNPSADTAHAE